MRTSWHHIWGSARGLAAGLSPPARIACAAGIFAACLVSPARSADGVAFILCAAALWVLAVRPPLRLVTGSLLLGLIVFLPYFLLVPAIRMMGPAGDWKSAMGPPAEILVRGMALMQVATATVSSLTAVDLRRGLLGLPIPRVVSAVLIQIVHQTAVLLYETRRIASAVSVRGGSSGMTLALRLIGSMPRVWLPRILSRVERIGAAMEMRGYADFDLREMDSVDRRGADLPALGLVLLVLAAAVALRIMGGAI